MLSQPSKTLALQQKTEIGGGTLSPIPSLISNQNLIYTEHSLYANYCSSNNNQVRAQKNRFEFIPNPKPLTYKANH